MPLYFILVVLVFNCVLLCFPVKFEGIIVLESAVLTPSMMLACTGKLLAALPRLVGSSTLVSASESLQLCSRQYAALAAVKLPPANENNAREFEPTDVVRKDGPVDVVPRRKKDEEIQQIIKEIACYTELESPRLFASYDVGKPLEGELAPIRKREHRYEPKPTVYSQVEAEKYSKMRPKTKWFVLLQSERDRSLRGVLNWLAAWVLAKRRKAQA